MAKREYKDTVFVDLFFHYEKAHENFASLFSALCRFLSIDFQFEVSDLLPISLESSLYNGKRTDVLYNIKDSILVFIEHQSTLNPNMPLRDLEYLVEVLKKLPFGRTKYGSKALSLQDVIFLNLYNGREEVEDVYDSYLSKLIKTPVLKYSSLELKVTNININAGHNEKLLKMCPVLEEYSLFVDEVRKQLKMDKEKGLDIAVDNCIKQGILAEYLEKNRSGVMGLFFGNFDMETVVEVAKEESYEEGIAVGIEQGIEQGRTEGFYDAKLDTAKRLFDMGLSVDDIAKATMLQEEEIKKILK